MFIYVFGCVRPSALKATEKIHQQLASRKPMKALRSVGGTLALPKTPEVVRLIFIALMMLRPLPYCLSFRRYRLKEQTNKTQKTAEERELENIQRLQQEAKKKLILSQKSLKKSRATNSQATINPVKSSKPPTEAVGFHFRTEERLRKRSGNRPRGVSPSTSAEFDFPSTLRRSDSNSFSSVSGIIMIMYTLTADSKISTNIVLFLFARKFECIKQPFMCQIIHTIKS